MLDNLNGSSESELVKRLQEARSPEEPASAPIESTDETEGETLEAESTEEIVEEVSDSEEVGTTEEVEEQEFYTIKAAGEEHEVSFDELVEGYQKGQDYYKKTSSLADDRKEFESLKAKDLEALSTERQRYSELINQLEANVNEQEKSAEYWEELLDSDPAEYIRQQKTLEAKKALVKEGRDKQQAEDIETRKQVNAYHAQVLLKEVGSAWDDEQVKAKELDGMYKYVYDRGMSQEEVAQVFDYRFWLTVRDAMKYRESQKVGDVVKKQVRKAPKTVKSKQPVRVPDQEVKDIKKRVKSSGGKSEKDLVALMQAKRNR